MKIENIISGWTNYIIPDPLVNEEAKKRAAVCAGCPFAKEGTFTALLRDGIKDIEGLYCSACTCPLSAKVRSKREKCPKNKW